jgi:hypothetical protein
MKINIYLLIFILIFIIIFRKYEYFSELNLENINKLNDENFLKISINEISADLIKNTYYGSKYKSDNFMIIMDNLCGDYLNFMDKNCTNLYIITLLPNLNLESSIESNKQILTNYLIEKLNFINKSNLDNVISSIIHTISNLYFNEYISNCI